MIANCITRLKEDLDLRRWERLITGAGISFLFVYFFLQGVVVRLDEGQFMAQVNNICQIVQDLRLLRYEYFPRILSN